MRVVCLPDPAPLESTEGVAFSLFQPPQQVGVGRVATSMIKDLRRAGVQPSPRAWDFLAIALSVAAADLGCLRKNSPDGWTRDIRLEVAVTDPIFWATQASALEAGVTIPDERYLATYVCLRRCSSPPEVTKDSSPVRWRERVSALRWS